MSRPIMGPREKTGMTLTDRREFLKKLAKGAVYAVPVVVSLAAPVDVAGQGGSSQHHSHLQAAPTTDEKLNPTPQQPPWQKNPPPGRRP